jgi:hypothetical protein
MRFLRVAAVGLAALALVACSRGSADLIEDGSYAGVDSTGHEVALSIRGNGVNVNGVKTDVDSTADHLTFEVLEAGRPRWVCTPMDQGITCQVRMRDKTSTIELMQE